MLRISLLELLMKGIPEGLISGFGIFTLSKTKFDLRKFLLLSTSLILLTYLSRFLPLGYSLHIMISVMTIIVISTIILRMHLLNAIKAALLLIALIIICECGTICVMERIFLNDGVCRIMNNPLSKSFAGIPTTVLFGAIILIIYVNYYKKNNVKEF